ncbi:radical SAM protein [Ruminiclostridium cellulolyticum]|uniref:Radical SAM domain protein n=1 Tax=Ruminiclostridium cellulolyticum (strain ATCC 35319 / DSM 5812 / JCM 6584 / H10) TaxID=394503 RepID=B8I9E7_RUMCH|nr:radical SAM protein [Ruminiclostridium cellulolyticum]ACL75407.1 Radical SAM domain protein [Ruminiclostridium cellulolyticum H10]
MSKKVRLICNLNCSRRQMDMVKLESYLSANGYEVVEDEKQADQIVYTTCGFINETAQVAFNEIERLKSLPAELIVTGCLPDTDSETFNKIHSGKVVRNTELYKFDDVFGGDTKFQDIPDAHDMPWGKGEYFCVEVSRGCPENCSYCATKWAVGKMKSKPIQKCIEEIEEFKKSTFSKVVINGDNVGAYGLDIKETFGTLVSALPIEDEKYKAYIDSLHPRWLLLYYDAVLAAISKNRFGMLVSAIQAGNERVLELMRRKADMKKLKEAFIEIKQKSPEIVLGTEVIVGFPTESESDFIESVDFILSTKLDWGNIFAFSPKKGTEAAAIKGQVEEAEKIRRINYLVEKLKENGYFIFKEEKSQAVIFSNADICINADKSPNPYWQTCFDTVCLDRKKQNQIRSDLREGKIKVSEVSF